jgi:hypothetical protein
MDCINWHTHLPITVYNLSINIIGIFRQNFNRF